jgi:hypothetical protein
MEYLKNHRHLQNIFLISDAARQAMQGWPHNKKRLTTVFFLAG